jgi:hypothetical protein
VKVVAVGSSTVLASEQIGLSGQSVTFAYAAGEAANNSIGLIDRLVKDVF